MAQIRRIVVEWNGLAGLPGVSVFYSDDLSGATAGLVTFFGAIKSGIPAPCSWAVPGTGDLIESTTGELLGSWTDSGAATVTSTSSASYAAGTGMYVRWITGAVRNGRRFVGRTFLCPIGAGLYEADGTISGSYITTVQNASLALISAAPMMVWGRPSGPGATDGVAHDVLAPNIRDRVTSLKTRRV